MPPKAYTKWMVWMPKSTLIPSHLMSVFYNKHIRVSSYDFKLVVSAFLHALGESCFGPIETRSYCFLCLIIEGILGDKPYSRVWNELL